MTWYSSYLITVPLVPPDVVSMTLVVRLTLRSSWSSPSSSAQYSSVGLDVFFKVQPPGDRHGATGFKMSSTGTRTA